MSTPRCYVDTSLIIARYKPSDNLYKDSNAFFKSNLDFVISPITLVELYCVLSRVRSELDVPMQAEPLIDTLITFIIRDCRLKLLSKNYYVKKDFGPQECRMGLEYYIATRFAERLGLRTLDMLHLSHAWILKKASGVGLFVTGNEEILEKAEAIRKSLGIKVYHPKQLV
ncbi:MAG: PIN domain-containing protein [Thermoproteota archaeon]|nr:PIN domain-containing protein [Candidatus Brockarchaeota archaeon]